MLDRMEHQRQTSEKRIGDLDDVVKRYTQTTLALESKVIELQNVIRRFEDVESQLRTERELNRQLTQRNQDLQNELDTASAYIIELEEKYYKSQRTSLELLKQLKSSEATCDEMQVEIETLRNYIIDLKSRIAVYIPVKGDAIDKRIAEYINNYPDRQKLKIMFMRESEGVYQFGSKRVLIRVDKDKINIRVGGGHLSIDEFLDQYTPTELKLLERKDPLKRLSEKVAVGKTISGHQVRDRSGSPQPISPRKSPKKHQF